MEENNKLEEMNTEPVVQLIIPRDNGQEKIFSVTRKKGMTLAGLLAVVFVCLAGAAGFYGWQYHHTPIDKAAYREYPGFTAGSIITRLLIKRRTGSILTINRSRKQSSSLCWKIMKKCCGT